MQQSDKERKNKAEEENNNKTNMNRKMENNVCSGVSGTRIEEVYSLLEIRILSSTSGSQTAQVEGKETSANLIRGGSLRSS